MQLGKAIRKNIGTRTHRVAHGGGRHTVDLLDQTEERQNRLVSIMERNDIDEFLVNSQMAGRTFEATKDKVRIVNSAETQVVGQTTGQTSVEFGQSLENLNKGLSVPRRPPWYPEMTKEQIQSSENLAFLEWRRKLAGAEEDSINRVTPYEKNIDIWRQLWRVVENSNVLLIIADARNPLAFRSVDLEDYILNADAGYQILPSKSDGSDGVPLHRLDRSFLLLLNKADLLTENERTAWANYFNANNIQFAYFSAKLAEESNASNQPKTDEKESESEKEKDEEAENEEEREGDVESDKDAEPDEEKKEEEQPQPSQPPKSITNPSLVTLNTPTILTRQNLFDVLLTVYSSRVKGVDPRHPFSATRLNKGDDERGTDEEEIPSRRCLCVGLIGYPNVGKSSVLNCLMQKKCVATGSTPGKTKHLQTHWLKGEDAIGAGTDQMPYFLLLDCPGLVFPSWRKTTGDLLCDGIYPIDQMRDALEPISLILDRIPLQAFEAEYRLALAEVGAIQNKTEQARGLCAAFGLSKGFMTPHGQPDTSRAARVLLKDYVNGKLVFVHPPPQSTVNRYSELTKLPLHEATSLAHNPSVSRDEIHQKRKSQKRSHRGKRRK
ncbi:putative Large subunit GTPase 1 like protein [Blattamonas nauphoetae]|uniref:Large subunit GTPase 1 like protein n=1 Tax=Blattamonas nauphoetae TaxID=2049346 RepID=A0ABQ9YKZ1_9EUKA|nr:putative Large subunit GTPase 1 like protein [Blattamonas nauphoetae]